MARIPAIENTLDRIEQQKADKTDIDKIMGVLDTQAQNIDIMRTERFAISGTLDRHEKRITSVEEKETGYRIRDKRE